MISILATAVVTPFMMADQAAATPVAAQETAPVYNWENQNAKSIENEEDFKTGLMASSSYIAGCNQIDDWHMC